MFIFQYQKMFFLLLMNIFLILIGTIFVHQMTFLCKIKHFIARVLVYLTFNQFSIQMFFQGNVTVKIKSHVSWTELSCKLFNLI